MSKTMTMPARVKLILRSSIKRHLWIIAALLIAFGDFRRSGLFLKIFRTKIAKIDSRIFGGREGVVFPWRDAMERAYSARIRRAVPCTAQWRGVGGGVERIAKKVVANVISEEQLQAKT